MAHKFSRRTALKLGAGGIAVAAIGAPAVLRAQSAYPDRPISVVVPFDTGGYNDRLARAFAPFLQETLGQPLVIVNRGGAGALLGHSYFMQQPDDGYAILCTSAAPYLPLNILTQDAPFKLEDFHMINLPSRDYTLMATSSDSDLKSIEEVITRLKADSGSLSIGIQPSSADLVNMILFADANGIDREGLRLVTYDGGGPTRNAAAGGVVDIGLVGGQGFLPLAEKITPLLVFDDGPRDGWSCPLVTEVNGADAQFVAGSQRGWAVHASFVEKHGDRYQTLLGAIESTSKDPRVIESLEGQQLATDWLGPDSSNRALGNTAKVMAAHIDLLKGT
ncbi:MAG: Bug family tripartite tricarboxylate transporter substrate binding protein [Kiloniellaceae bacterium]